MSENKPDALALNVAAFGVMEAALKIEMELAGGPFLNVRGKMVLAALGALHTEIDALIALARMPTVTPEKAMQGDLSELCDILQFDQDNLGLRISALDGVVEEIFATLTQDALQYCQALQDETNLEPSLMTVETLRKIIILSRTKIIIRELASALQNQIKTLSNGIRVLRLETLAASLEVVEATPAKDAG